MMTMNNLLKYSKGAHRIEHRVRVSKGKETDVRHSLDFVGNDNFHNAINATSQILEDLKVDSTWFDTFVINYGPFVLEEPKPYKTQNINPESMVGFNGESIQFHTTLEDPPPFYLEELIERAEVPDQWKFLFMRYANSFSVYVGLNYNIETKKVTTSLYKWVYPSMFYYQSWWNSTPPGTLSELKRWSNSIPNFLIDFKPGKVDIQSQVPFPHIDVSKIPVSIDKCSWFGVSWDELISKLCIKRGETPQEIDNYGYYYTSEMLNERID